MSENRISKIRTVSDIPEYRSGSLPGPNTKDTDVRYMDGERKQENKGEIPVRMIEKSKRIGHVTASNRSFSGLDTKPVRSSKKTADSTAEGDRKVNQRGGGRKNGRRKTASGKQITRRKYKLKTMVSAPMRGAADSLKQSAERSTNAGQSSGMNSYELARDTFAERRRLNEQLQELMKAVVRVVKAVAATAILPFAVIMVLVALVITSVISIFSGAGSQEGRKIPNPSTERQVIYNGLIEEFEGNQVAAVGVMCALMAESGCHANATEGAEDWGVTAEEYTEQVNDHSVSEDDFINSIYDGVQGSRGYGIAQWSTVDRKKGLYEYARKWSVDKKKGFDIADIDMQVEHLRETVRNSYPSLREKLLTETDMEDACYLWISTYEHPSQKNSTWEEKAVYDVKTYADEIQKECTYDMDRGNILWPVPSVKVGSVTSKFGYRGNIGIPGATKNHKGIDIGAAEGADIVAVASGTVKTVTYDSARGNYVVIDHGGGKETWYQHMKTTAVVKQGESVAAGTLLGYVGHTGVSGGSHLHFEVHIGGTPVDPLQYYEP